MVKFTELEKNALMNMDDFPTVSMAVLGDCATQHLCKAIRGSGYTKKLNIQIWEADYDQIDMQMNDPDAEIWSQQYDFILLMMCQEKLYEKYCNTPANERSMFAERMLGYIKSNWEAIRTHFNKIKILQSNFTVVDDAVFGSYSNKVKSSYVHQVRKLNYLLMDVVSGPEAKDVFLVDMDMLQQKIGADNLHDHRTYYVGKLPVPTKLLPNAAALVLDTVLSIRGGVHKCVITDLDNTLWGGVIGDDGIENIQIGELGEGQAYSALQRWLKELKERGIILAVCSKNEEATAKEPFEKHPEMILHLDDIAMFVANWHDKASNIQYIRQTLNIGMDSIVFLDDNPFERNLVKESFPDIFVPELPEDATEYLPYLQSLNLFETASFSEEDSMRTGQYQAEISRNTEKERFVNYDDYLEALKMEAVAANFDVFHRPRIAQLTQRSNQFNLRTVRYTESDVKSLSESDEFITLYFTLKDKYGDHGLISVVVLKKLDEALFVEEWLMSCRVLKRGTEEMVCNTIIDCAKRHGYEKVIGEYIPTAKNKMVENLYLDMGFSVLGNNRFEVYVDDFVEHATFISVTKNYN